MDYIRQDIYIYISSLWEADFFSLPLNVKSANAVRPKMVSRYNKMAIFSYFRHARRRRRDAKVYSISSKVAEIQADTAVIWDIPLVSPGLDADVHLMIISTIAIPPPLHPGRRKGEGKLLSIERSRLPIFISRSRLSYSLHSLIRGPFQMHDERSFIIITSARITQSDRSYTSLISRRFESRY